MVARGPGAVGCAHCRMIGAEVECRVCDRLVCPACAADWTTCEEPSGRMIRLGTTARLRDVDPSGRLGLVSRWVGRMRLLDLRRLCWVAGPGLPSYRSVGLRTTVPARLTALGWLLGPADLEPVPPEPHVLMGTQVMSLTTGQAGLVAVAPQAHGAMVSAVGNRYWYVTDRESVVVIRLDPDPVPEAIRHVTFGSIDGWHADSFEPLPGKVMQSAHVDGGRDLLAVSTWGLVALARMEDGQLRPLGRAEAPGDVRWVAVGGHRLAALVEDRGAIQVWGLNDDLTIGEMMYRHTCASRVRAASLSRDGRYLAVGLDDRRVEVHALDTGDVTTFTEHTDTICLVAFAGDDHLLVTADDDNRVVIRPRIANGYARPAMPVELSAETIGIAEVLGGRPVDKGDTVPS